MRKSLMALLVASALTAGVAAASTLYAHDSESSQGSMMGQGMMMENCNQMMQSMMRQHGSEKPNEQWQNETPATPEENG